jgi:Domain of unknown function (DUF3327)
MAVIAGQNQMVRIADSGVWYISCVIRNDARFAYALSPNDSLLSLLDSARSPIRATRPLTTLLSLFMLLIRHRLAQTTLCRVPAIGDEHDKALRPANLTHTVT